jgi:TRAP-type uncharacterized transport system fused permease subunit
MKDYVIAIIASVIPSILTLIGVIITVRSGQKKSEQSIKIQQAITDTKIDNLTREVREHNGFARRMPVIEEQIKIINHRIDDLENQRKG